MNYNWRLSAAETFNLREAVKERPELHLTARLRFCSASLWRCEETRSSAFYVSTLFFSPMLIPLTSRIHGVIPVWWNDKNVCTLELTGTVLARGNMDLNISEELIWRSQTARRSSCSTWWVAHPLDRRLDGVQPTTECKPGTGARLVKTRGLPGQCRLVEHTLVPTHDLCVVAATCSHLGRRRRSHVTACYQHVSGGDGLRKKKIGAGWVRVRTLSCVLLR